jgi:hypothetical protein
MSVTVPEIKNCVEELKHLFRYYKKDTGVIDSSFFSILDAQAITHLGRTRILSTGAVGPEESLHQR